MRKIQEFMIGRNGFDSISITALVVFVVLRFIAGFFPGSAVIRFIPLIAFIVFLWRFLSRKTEKSDKMLYSFNTFAEKIKNKFEMMRYKKSDRPLTDVKYSEKKHETVTVSCQGCGQMLRLPKGKGSIIVSCPKCGLEFKTNT